MFALQRFTEQSRSLPVPSLNTFHVYFPDLRAITRDLESRLMISYVTLVNIT